MTRRVRLRSFLLPALLLAFAAGTTAGSPWGDLDLGTQKALVQGMKAYLDPDVDFVWRARKKMLSLFETLKKDKGIDALADVDFLQDLVYQGRHFLDRFEEKTWQRAHQATYRMNEGLYQNVKSEQWRFTWTVPRSYPSKPSLERTFPRHAPYPLLVSIHEEQDTVDSQGRTQDFPGQAVLERRYPKERFEALYDDWLVLAPAAPLGRFLEEDGSVRHEVLTTVLTEFWRHYHVDFDRIVLDGTEPPMALAATFPQVFAGLVLRGGTVHPDEVPNFANVPVFVVDDAYLARQLADAGHPDVTSGSDEDLLGWLSRRRRRTPRAFSWNAVRKDQAYSQWIAIEKADFQAPRRTLSVEVLDTQDDPNTIRITSEGIGKLALSLNDRILDLDRDVRIVWNGRETRPGRLERSFDQCFQKSADVRKNMDFGWLFPVVVEVDDKGPSAVRTPAETPSTEPEPAPVEDDLALRAEEAFLQGRLDLLDGILAEAGSPEDVLPLALRDLWWRRSRNPELRARYEALAARATGMTARRYRWLLDGGRGPWPEPADPHTDRWRVLTALVHDRELRETLGSDYVEEMSPIDRLEPPPQWDSWWARWKARFLGVRRDVYGNVPPEDLGAAERRREANQRAETSDALERNWILAAALLAAFVGGVLLLGHRLGRRRSGAS